jgi:hypothetical protein
MPRTISDQEDAYYRGKEQVANFAASIWDDPALNEDAKRLAKRKYPNLQMPDLDIMDKVNARFAKEKEERDAERKEQRERHENETWQNNRKSVQSKYGITDEGMADLEKFMIDKNVGDYEVAAGYRIQKEPKVSEGGVDTGRWHHEKQPEWQQIAKDPEGWGRAEILKAIRADEEKARGQGY